MPENPPNSSEPISNENVARVLALLRTGDQKIGSTRVDNAILIVGKSGSGKTTLTNFLAGNNEDLISEELGQDTGEFIIRDKNNKISSGNSTIISKTIFPEVIYDRETKTAYIDCPGFNDRGRNEAYDIASAYFIKKALENVKNIKIVLTVNYPSLQSGVSRDDFPHLLERVTTLIKNIDRYVDSVALVATKVYNSYTKRKIQGQVDLILVPDKLVIENIAKFLLQVEESLKNIQTSEVILKSNSTLSQNGEFFDNSRKLLDALLQKKGTEYTRLGLFRRPDAAGPVSEIELLQNGKTLLKRMLENNLSYAPVDLASIGYAVSDMSKNIIRELVEEINKSIVYDVSQIKDMLIDLFKDLENDFYHDDIYVLKEHLENWSIILAKISAINESANANELISLIENNFPESCKLACKPIFDDIKNLGKFVKFLQDVSEKQFDSFAWKWVGELREAIAYVENSFKWYNFLIALYEQLSDYEVQKDIKRFHVPKFDSASGQLENYTDFSKFCHEISNSRLLTVQYLKELQKVTIDDIKVRYFNQVIESTLRRPLSFSVFNNSGPRFQVTGEYVKISDVIQHSLYPESKSVQVLATHTVFIDADMTKENDISIIAPRWVIVGSRVINLNGSPGEDWFPNKASNCSYDGCNGLNGLPGKPGRSAGLFFGLGDEFENSSQLQIQAIGGVGGDGQRGGDGAKGVSGSTYDIEKSKKDLYCPSGLACSSVLESEHDSWCYKQTVFHTMYGSGGGRGGDAGRGGAPGLGGLAGNITVLGLGITNPPILQQVTKGNDGEFGLHGTCGEGGDGGYIRISKVCINCNSAEEDAVYNGEKAPDGTKGVCLYFSSVENSNIEGRANPAELYFLYPPASMISDFRNELVKNFDNCVRKSHSLKFYRMLQREDILKYDNIDVIFSEFKQLEQYYNKFPLGLSESLYEFISRRIDDISKQLSDWSHADRRKLLELMLSELLSSSVSFKLIRLKKNPHAELAFNYRDYFDVMETVNEEKIGRYFINRANKEIEQAEHVVKIVSSDIFHAAERTISEICSFSPNDNLEKLKRHLLKLKLFFIFKLVDDVLDLVTSMTKVDPAPIQTTDTSAVGESTRKIEPKLVAIEEVAEKEIYAIKEAIFNEIRSLQSLGDEFDPIVDQLRDVQANLKSRRSITDRVVFTPMFFSGISDELQIIKGINSALLTNYGLKVNESVINFENAVKVIQWNVDLHHALAKAEFNGTDLISSIDNLREKGKIFNDTARYVLALLNAPVFIFIRKSRTSDFYSSEFYQLFRKVVTEYLGGLNSEIHTLVSQFDIDEDLPPIVKNLDEIFNQLMIILYKVLPAHHNLPLLNSLDSLVEMKDVLGDHVLNYLTKVIRADKLFYEYEHLVDACKTSIFPFDILTNRMLAFPVTPHVDESSMQHQSIIASNIKLLEIELDSWEQRINNVTTNEAFNSGNENGAFFVWRYDQYEDSIRKLLRGRAVVLKASLDDVGDERQWLKFDNIGLRFISTNSTVQQSLDEDLKYFNVSMTHMGDSHFSLCNDVRFVRQDATRFSRNFNETTARVVDPINSSLKPILSPFATWIFKLHPINEDATFSILNPYRKLPIGIELEGNATFVDSINRTMCQKIVLSDSDIHQLPSRLENDQEVMKNISGVDQPPSTTLASSSVADQLVSSTEISSTYSNTMERKKRDIGSSSSVPDNRGFDWRNPYNYFFSVKPNPEFELPSKTMFSGQDEEHFPNIDYSPPLNINGALALIDFVVRNITKIKPYRSMEKSMSAKEARVIALNIIEELENMLSQLPEEKRISLSDWQEKDPVQLLGQLEKNIMTGDLSSVKEILFDLVPLDIPDDELDSLLGRHLGSADIRENFENHRSTVADGRGHLFGVMDVDFTDQADIPSANYSFNQTALE